MYLRKEFTFCKCINIDSSLLIHVKLLPYTLVEVLWLWIFFTLILFYIFFQLKPTLKTIILLLFLNFPSKRKMTNLKKLRNILSRVCSSFWDTAMIAETRCLCQRSLWPGPSWSLDSGISSYGMLHLFFCLYWFQLLQCGVSGPD